MGRGASRTYIPPAGERFGLLNQKGYSSGFISDQTLPGPSAFGVTNGSSVERGRQGRYINEPVALPAAPVSAVILRLLAKRRSNLAAALDEPGGHARLRLTLVVNLVARVR